MTASGPGVGVPARIAFEGGVPASGVRMVAVETHGNGACAMLDTAVRCWSTYDMPTLPQVQVAPSTIALAGVSSIATGHGVTCAVAGPIGGRRLYCWDGRSPPAPVPWAASAREPAAVAIDEQYACLLDVAGDVACWESMIIPFWRVRPSRSASWAGKPPVRDLAIGDSPICTVDALGRVDCFLAAEGGLTDQAKAKSWATSALGPHPIPGVDGAVHLGVGAGRDVFGYGYGCALRGVPDHAGAQVFCWGDNELGQLGAGDARGSRDARPVLCATP